MDISGAVSRAIARSRRVMFQPFNLGAWFSFGFVFFLASLIDPIGGWNGKLRFPDLHPHRTAPSTMPEIPELPPELSNAFDQHRVAMLAGLVAMLVLGIVTSIVLMWVGCRGLMMAYRSASIGYVGISEGWRETAKPANALFRFHLVIGGASFVVSAPLLALAWMSVAAAWQSGERDLGILTRAALPFLLLTGIVTIAGALVLFVSRQFIAPFLLFFPCTVREAWVRFFQVLRADTANVLVFMLARVVLAAVVGVLSSFISTLTCCIGGLPVLHQTVLSPILFFDRAFTLHTLASLGPEYAAMTPELPPNPWRR